MALDEDTHVDRLIVHPFLQRLVLPFCRRIYQVVRLHPHNFQSTYFRDFHLQSLDGDDENVLSL